VRASAIAGAQILETVVPIRVGHAAEPGLGRVKAAVACTAADRGIRVAIEKLICFEVLLQCALDIDATSLEALGRLDDELLGFRRWA